jgi:hypothetical protein
LTEGPFVVKGVETTDPDLQVVTAGSDPCVYTISCRIANRGDQSAHVMIRVADRENKEYTVDIPVFYHGAPAD